MKLLTKEIINKFRKTGRQDKDPIIIAKFFYPMGAGTWYATEFDEENKLFYGFCDPFGDPTCAEWGDFSLEEFEDFNRGRMVGIERDLYFGYPRVSECKEIQKRMGK